MKFKIILLIFLLVSSGCIHSKEHLFLQGDGSGRLESEIMIPNGTMHLIDNMLGKMAQAMAQAFGEEEEQPESVSEQMFASKKEILKKAQSMGVNIEFISFNKEKKDDGLYVDYKLKFDDVNKLMDAEIVSAKLKIGKDPSGNWFCRVEKNSQGAQGSKAQVDQLENFQDTDGFKEMGPMMQKMMLEAMSDLRMEFLMTMPYEIKKYSGLFEKVDSNTARLRIEGDFLKDPSVIDKIYGIANVPAEAVWDAGGLGSSVTQGTKEKSERNVNAVTSALLKQEKAANLEAHQDSSPKADSSVSVYLKNGNTVKGELIEETDEYTKVNSHGVTITYYKDEILKVE